MIQDVLDQVFEKASEWCSNPENSSKITEKVVTPILVSLAERFQWLFSVIQILAALIVIQTVLTVVVLVRMHGSRT
jgi:hypothetical protein